MKYILVTGGVISGVGKGVISSSFGAILKSIGIEVTMIKIDPYMNLDAGTFSPYEHGEVYVLDDGGEVDLDLGNYERFLNITLHKENNITSGKVFQAVISKERRGDYLGKTVQVVPHLTDFIQEWVEKVAQIPISDSGKTPEVCIIELGGVIGDIESGAFVEAFRQFQFRVKRENFCVAHVSLVPQPKTTGESKSKPTQSSVRELRGLGLSPDIIVCRSERPLEDSVKEKISNFCHVAPQQIISVPDLSSVYEVPVFIENHCIADFLCERLHLDVVPLPPRQQYMAQWLELGEKMRHLKYEVSVAIVGKYTRLEDSYTSITKALHHAGNTIGYKVNIKFIEASNLEKDMLRDDPASYHTSWRELCLCQCVVVPGGFGRRGVQGKIEAIKWCRLNKRPFLGICLGFQAAVIEFARNELGMSDANSTEIADDTEHPVVIDMPEHNTGEMGGTMRLGKRTTIFKESAKNSIIRRLYGNRDKIEERHRHRYEVNPKYIADFENRGLKFVGVDVEQQRMEIFELEGHPYFIGVQFHPEYMSRPIKPSPPFMGLVLAAKGNLTNLSNGCKLTNGEILKNIAKKTATVPVLTKQQKLPSRCENGVSDFFTRSLSQYEDFQRPHRTNAASRMKYILVTGGVISGVGKGVISSSFGAILKSIGIEVTMIKIDPYINLDAGTFSPYEHGEVYVLEDGGEVDLDLGNYERFLNITLHKDNNITSGKVYQSVIGKERRGDYLGKTVQVVPHLTDFIQEWVQKVAQKPVSDSGKTPEVCIIELGGVIGDIESGAFVEAFRQFQFRVKRENFCVAHVSLVPQPKTTGESKSKPTQSSVRELRGLGLSPDIIVCRSERPLEDSVKEKISNFCHVAPQQIISVPDLSSVYEVPVFIENHGMADFLCERLHLGVTPLPPREQYMAQWLELGEKLRHLKYDISVAIVGKYTRLEDSYTSITKALRHSGGKLGCNVNIKFIEASNLEKEMLDDNPADYHTAWRELCLCQCVVVPGGFGRRGVQGKIEAVRWCRTNKKPFLGICLGFQAAVIEFARNELGMSDAHSTEICEDTEHPVVIDMPEHNTGEMGGTMRLGKRTTVFKESAKNSIIRRLYGNRDKIEERHRHRYEVNPKYIADFENRGLKFVGVDVEQQRMEILELENHPYFVGVQFHPEYLSRPVSPSPPFMGLLMAARGNLTNFLANDCQLTNGDVSKHRFRSGELVQNGFHSSSSEENLY